ncbi:methyltransferase FGSG_00040-like [Actinidia eriantha]|uniref:methyltransferase FGSG_00040-like n=1 Tax=Actinidia eriantha TaxID=165200 RepID=UPI00258C76FC|nr:methyltransferase FGSG_00040-like [Actinidia eriantha]
MEEERMQQIRSKAKDLLLIREWKESVQAYSHFISLCQDQISKTHQEPDPKLRKSLCLALSNRAEARSRMQDFAEALTDCDWALEIESAHFKTLLCKGKILLSLNRYGLALDCFKLALLDSQASLDCESINGYLEKCKKLEFLSRTGAFNLSDWVMNGFCGKSPELGEYIGGVEIKRSEMGGRGLFATKNVDCGTLLFVTKAIATERSILPSGDLGKNTQLVMWKNLIDKVVDLATKCHRTHHLISNLSTGEDEDGLEVPDIRLFRPEAEDKNFLNEKLDMGKIVSILDVNSLIEDSTSSKVLGKNKGYYGVGLWLLASFINHSCNPNARRLHIGDYMIVHASRDIKAGEEVTFAYFDVLSPLSNRREMSKTWGFDCGCKRCKFEKCLCGKQEMREIEMGIERGLEVGGMVFRLEEGMRRWTVRGKEKGYLRASFWGVYGKTFGCEKEMGRWGRRIPAVEAVVDSIVEAVGSDERVLRVLKDGLKSIGGGGGGVGMVEREREMKLGRGVYGKGMKKQAMRTLLELSFQEQKI